GDLVTGVQTCALPIFEAALFAAGDQALIALSRASLFEKPLSMKKPAKQMTTAANGQMHMAIDFGDLTNSDAICLPEGSGPQIARSEGRRGGNEPRAGA